jgi:hypothetical protein
VQQLGSDVAVILLCWQCRQVLAQAATSLARDISGRHKLPGGKLPRVGNVVQVKKMSFWNLSGTTGRKTPVDTSPIRC